MQSCRLLSNTAYLDRSYRNKKKAQKRSFKKLFCQIYESFIASLATAPFLNAYILLYVNDLAMMSGQADTKALRCTAIKAFTATRCRMLEWRI